MDANNSMIANNNTMHKSSKIKDKSRKDKKSGTKPFKMNQIEITCENEPKTKYNITSEEFAIHIIDCDSCLKNLFLNQAKRKEKESELLLENKKSKRSKHKKSRKDNNINNSMEQGYKVDTADNSEESSEKEDESSNEEENDNNNFNVNNSMITNKINSFSKKLRI